MSELRVIIAGSRDFDNYNFLLAECNKIINCIFDNETYSAVRIISGTARGADKLGERYANNKGYNVKQFPADWAIFGKRAGYLRNRDMAKYAIEEGSKGVLIAFWDGESKGTKHMIDIAYELGLSVYVVNV